MQLHIGVDADTGKTVAAALSTNDVDDGSQVGPLLDRTIVPLSRLHRVTVRMIRKASTPASPDRHAEAAVAGPPRSTAVLSETVDRADTARLPFAADRREGQDGVAEGVRA